MWEILFLRIWFTWLPTLCIAMGSLLENQADHVASLVRYWLLLLLFGVVLPGVHCPGWTPYRTLFFVIILNKTWMFGHSKLRVTTWSTPPILCYNLSYVQVPEHSQIWKSLYLAGPFWTYLFLCQDLLSGLGMLIMILATLAGSCLQHSMLYKGCSPVLHMLFLHLYSSFYLSP